MTIVLGVSVGLFVAVIICDPAVRFIIRRVRIEPTPPKSLGESPDEWPLKTFVSDKGARWFGGLERGLYFVAFYQGSPELIAGWLLFKVASKWESWNNIVRVPETLAGVDPLEFLRFRHAWGVSLMQSFLTGTLANILSGLAGALLAARLIMVLGG